MPRPTQPASFSRMLASAYLFCGVVVLYLVSTWSVSAVLIDPDDAAPWKRLVNLRNNSYHLWQWDPCSAFVSETLSSIGAWCGLAPVSPTCVQAIILLLGSILVALAIRPTRGAPHPAIGLLGCLPVLLVVVCSGWDPVTIGAIAWIPLLALVSTALIFIVRRGQGFVAGPVWIVATFISIQHALASNQMAILSGFVAIIIASILAAEDSSSTPPQEQPVQDASIAPSVWRSPLFHVALIVMVPACIATFIRAPHAPIPDYPYLAHVVADDGLNGVISPLTGRDYQLHVLDRSTLKSDLLTPTLIVGATLFVAWLLLRKQLRQKGTRTILFAMFLSATLLLDLALPERYAALAPLMSLSRLTPWGTIISTPTLTLSLAAWLLGILLLSTPARAISALLLAFTLGSCGYREWMHHESRQVEYAYLSDPALRAVSISPSAATLLFQRRATGSTPNNAIAAISLLADASWEKVYEHQAVFQISEGATTSRRQRDNTSVIAPPFEFPNQEGREFISISFNAPVTTRGISLDLGKRASDFPRGLSISTGTCENPGAPLADYPDWQGALALSPNGYPYFLTQSEVRIAFAQEATFSALCIGQTRKSDFDWYVKSIRIMKASIASTDQERH